MLRLPHGVSKRHTRDVAFRMRLQRLGSRRVGPAISLQIGRQEYCLAGTQDAEP
jgi:hypothetical protein